MEKKDPADRNTGTAIAEMLSIINGASIIRTHNPGLTSDVIKINKISHKKIQERLITDFFSLVGGSFDNTRRIHF